MGHLAKDAIWLAVEALIRKDINRITAVTAKNNEIDSLEFRTESRCMSLIATQQPVGNDLRVLGTCLKIVSDFDRLGDLAGVEFVNMSADTTRKLAQWLLRLKGV